mgnify:CR=1 FL=1
MKEIYLKILCLILATVINYLLTCGAIKLITMCFELNFNWLIATGIWLVLLIIRKY